MLCNNQSEVHRAGHVMSENSQREREREREREPLLSITDVVEST